MSDPLTHSDTLKLIHALKPLSGLRSGLPSGDRGGLRAMLRALRSETEGIVWGHFRTRTNMEGVTSETAQS